MTLPERLPTDAYPESYIARLPAFNYDTLLELREEYLRLRELERVVNERETALELELAAIKRQGDQLHEQAGFFRGVLRNYAVEAL